MNILHMWSWPWTGVSEICTWHIFPHWLTRLWKNFKIHLSMSMFLADANYRFLSTVTFSLIGALLVLFTTFCFYLLNISAKQLYNLSMHIKAMKATRRHGYLTFNKRKLWPLFYMLTSSWLWVSKSCTRHTVLNRSTHLLSNFKA